MMRTEHRVFNSQYTFLGQLMTKFYMKLIYIIKFFNIYKLLFSLLSDISLPVNTAQKHIYYHHLIKNAKPIKLNKK